MTDASVLVVDDEPLITEMFEVWLGGEYDVTVAHDGATALEKLDEDVDVVLLDRMMPGLSGDDALEEIRNRGYDCRVAMVTAVEPDFDVLEMRFDDYLTKPVTEDDLTDLVETLLSRATYEDSVQEYFALASKKATLEAAKPVEELENHDEYQELTVALAELRESVDQTLADQQDFEAAFRDL
jgi:DNA-binding response OmpR family regulator